MASVFGRARAEDPAGLVHWCGGARVRTPRLRPGCPAGQGPRRWPAGRRNQLHTEGLRRYVNMRRMMGARLLTAAQGNDKYGREKAKRNLVILD